MIQLVQSDVQKVGFFLNPANNDNWGKIPLGDTMEIEIIKDYYDQRGLGWPDQKSALLFFLSEVGELAEAYLAIRPVELSEEEQELFEYFAELGLKADEIVSRKPGWIRNNDRLRKENIAHEAADCNMMLSVFMDTYNGQSPDAALLEKMELKLGKPLST